MAELEPKAYGLDPYNLLLLLKALNASMDKNDIARLPAFEEAGFTIDEVGAFLYEEIPVVLDPSHARKLIDAGLAEDLLDTGYLLQQVPQLASDDVATLLIDRKVLAGVLTEIPQVAFQDYLALMRYGFAPDDAEAFSISDHETLRRILALTELGILPTDIQRILTEYEQDLEFVVETLQSSEFGPLENDWHERLQNAINERVLNQKRAQIDTTERYLSELQTELDQLEVDKPADES